MIRVRKQFASDSEIRQRLGQTLPIVFDVHVLDGMRAEVEGLDAEVAVDVTLALASEVLTRESIIIHRLIHPCVHFSAIKRRLIRGRAILKSRRRATLDRL
jgi:hypothetical protein